MLKWTLLANVRSACRAIVGQTLMLKQNIEHRSLKDNGRRTRTRCSLAEWQHCNDDSYWLHCLASDSSIHDIDSFIHIQKIDNGS